MATCGVVGTNLAHVGPIQLPDTPERAVRVRALWRRYEIRTWLVSLTIYGGWLALTWYALALPWWTVVLLIGGLVGWHNSLQHEAVHGHPTNSAIVNNALGGVPLGLWMPFHAYRRTHLRHHQVAMLTDPERDPESFYVSAQRWSAMATPVRVLLSFNNSLLGRLTVGPAIAATLFWYSEVGELLGGSEPVNDFETVTITIY